MPQKMTDYRIKAATKEEWADRALRAEAKLANAVEEAFYEGFCEGRDGGWVWGDPTPAWKKSEALAELKGHGDE
jgi:hypothetical protein